ncbi:glycosyltransferase [Desulforamulus putei]|uniref:Glycosyl transferase family 2 n=1 Tax=Desulforamulus putei DSM 12395 TaxID=1121429 RepID=A0A1M4VCT1_9FIRM|nr:glycosyltransferase [Desulforamulus putei]SHE66678.1 Glycosyl transferase family 2 [Desulforamulus putei DSM 12395]
MWETVCYLIILILACYGIYYLVQDLFRLFRHLPGPPVSMLVVMRNRAVDVEYLMRRLASWRKYQWVNLDVVVVDDGSEDDTANILRGLQANLSFRLVTLEPESPPEHPFRKDRALLTGLLYCHNALVWVVDLRKLPQGLLAEKVFRVFFCQGWR